MAVEAGPEGHLPGDRAGNIAVVLDGDQHFSEIFFGSKTVGPAQAQAVAVATGQRESIRCFRDRHGCGKCRLRGRVDKRERQWRHRRAWPHDLERCAADRASGSVGLALGVGVGLEPPTREAAADVGERRRPEGSIDRDVLGRRGLHRGGRHRGLARCRGDSRSDWLDSRRCYRRLLDSGRGHLFGGSRRRGELRDDEKVVGADHQDDQADGQDRSLIHVLLDRTGQRTGSYPPGWKG